MHRVTLIAPFVSSAEPDLAALLADDPYAVRDRLAALPGAWAWDRPAEHEVTSLIERHASTGASLLPGRLLSGARRQVPETWRAAGVTVVETTVGLHGVGCVVVWAELEDLDRLGQLERLLQPAVAEAAADVSRALVAAAPVAVAGEPRGRYERDSFLWWHRVLWSASTCGAWRDRMCDDVEVPAGNRLRMRVGDGFSALEGGTDDDVRAMAGGLARASEHWLLTETVGQQLLTQVAGLLRADGLDRAALEQAEGASTALAEREALRAGVVRDELRYVTGTQRAVLQACADCWHMPLDTGPVRDRLEVLQGMIARRVAADQARSQQRLNALALALTVVGSLALVLGVFETAVGSSARSMEPLRLLVAAGVALLAAACLVVPMRRRGPSRRG